MEEKKEIKVEPKTVATPVKKMTDFERERIASRQRAHELKVAKFLAGGK